MKTRILETLSSEDSLLGIEHQFHPWAAMDYAEGADYMLVHEGQGIYLWDETGKRFIDGPGGMWCSNWLWPL